MARVYNNWERLVRATLKREQLRSSGQGHERVPSGIAGAVPPSLGKTTNIDAILQAADAIQAEDPNVSRILCEQAYSMAQNLDPKSDGRGVLQFKTGLMSVIKQKLAKRDGAYKRRHKVDDIQRQEQRWRESGTFTADFGDYLEMKKTIATLRALVEVMEALSKYADPNGVGRLITEELRRIKNTDATLSVELTAYNIVPLEAPSLTNAIGVFPEVRGAISAIRYTEQFPRLPAAFEISGQRDADMFDLLECVFGFQKDNVRNQRENVLLTVANAQSRLGVPVEADPKIDEKAVNEVFLKVLDNYIKWCRYLRIRLAWNSLEAIDRDRKLFLVSLYFLIWGEAANVRFLPECICYIFHNMAKELDAILDHGEANPAASCRTESGSVSFLEQIICRIYETLAAEAARNNNGKAAHSSGGIMMTLMNTFGFRIFVEPKKGKRTGKSTFVEHRTFFHLYRSFHRLWIFLALMFQALTIIAFNGGHINLETFKTVLSIGPTFAIMNFIKSFLDVLLMFGAYTTARGMAISRLVIRFFALRIVLALLLKFPGCHSLSEMSDQSFFQFFKWIYQERYFVGRGLYEKMSDYCRSVLFWLVIFICKFTFTYFLQIKPLVEPTRIIVNLPSLEYSWHDLVSKHNKNALTVASLWTPVVAIYLMDIHIWYTLLSAIIGGVMGARSRLGEIRSIEMVHKRFESFPEAFVENLSHKIKGFSRFEDSAAIFSPFWNEIIKSLREEDFISNREMDLLCIPSNTGSLRLVQWPLFLLSSKADLWNRICRDEYMAYAVQECYYSIEKILYSLVDGEGRLWVERIYREINNSIMEGSLVITLVLKNLPLVLQRFTALTGLLIRNETDVLAKGAAKAVFDLYEVVTHDLLSSDLREQLDTWSLLAKARNEGRLFSRIKWANDPETKELVKRLHLLLTLVSEMVPFSVFTPYYSETVLYSSSELRVENEDGISILFYLQKIFQECYHFFHASNAPQICMKGNLLRLDAESARLLKYWYYSTWYFHAGLELLTGLNFLSLNYPKKNSMTDVELAACLDHYLVVSYFSQDCAWYDVLQKGFNATDYLERRSLGVTMDDHPPNVAFTSQGFELSRESRAQADLKFTYVVSCQIYGQQKQRKAPEAADISLLLQRNEALRVAYIHVEESGAIEGKTTKEFYSKLVKADIHGKDQEIYSIKLPGDPKLGEGKPENQNHAIVFTRGEAVQTIDMNQDNYLEEAMKMRNLLEEFHKNHGLRPPTILGVREHVFTGSVSSLAWFMSNQETSFVTLAQRVLAYPLKVRMHYGHPDVFDRIFHTTRGGISKASRVINISEDIFAGFNSTLRQGNITHHEYIQVGKGRDVGLNQIALFEGKVAGGNGEQVLSRDVYRLGQLFDFFRMFSYFYTTIGFYVCTMMTVLVVYIFLYGRVYLAFSGIDRAIATQAKLSGNTALDAVLNAQFLVQIGIFTAVPMIMGFILELGLLKAVFSFITMQLQLCSVFFTFSLGTRTHYFGRTILHGGAKYRATGRGFVVRHIKFAENYRLYSRSHFVKAFEVALLLIVYIAYGYTDGGAVSFVLLTLSSWFLVISWLFAPYIFNPSGFEWQKTVEDFDDWTSWLLYRGGVGVKGENSWESWWDEEQMHIQTLRGRILETILSLRFFLFQYGIVYKLHITGKGTSLAIYGFSWVVLVAIVMIFKVFTFSPKKSANFQLVMRFIQVVASLGLVAVIALLVLFTKLSVPDLFASFLAIVPTGWAILCLAITWKKIVRSLGLWDSVREFARMYDAGMGVLIFAPIAFLSWFPFISTFQSRLLFNQAFSRGLEISLILAGNKANVEV
ncbi:callose synthase 10 [Prunus yedoensis var. nudiflora]|uniref:1,3-beta-glucan synthase n=1 Tax=Prunus yedoensis var. nudiflora TaxID=2094558 RepID=A0A314UIY8_PRUYE|nr:callose synthase 10 [Prunus yedoensis var. nudiflora]